MTDNPQQRTWDLHVTVLTDLLPAVTDDPSHWPDHLRDTVAAVLALVDRTIADANPALAAPLHELCSALIRLRERPADEWNCRLGRGLHGVQAHRVRYRDRSRLPELVAVRDNLIQAHALTDLSADFSDLLPLPNPQR
jgi:hypothetical protein